MLSFKDTHVAFKDFSSKRLRQERHILNILTNEIKIVICKYTLQIFNFLHLKHPWFIGKNKLSTFWGGETINECMNTASKLWEKGIYSTIDDCLNNTYKPYTEDYFNFLVELFGETTKSPNIAFFTLNANNLIEPRILKIVSNNKLLNNKDKLAFDRFKEQICQLCKLAYKHDKPIIIEPIFYLSQNVINAITIEMMQEFNKERAIVYSSQYLCRLDSLPFIQTLNQKACKEGFIAGVKVVKGDKVEMEQNSNKEFNTITYETATEEQKAYSTALKYCISNIDSMALIFGSHSEENIILALALMDNNHIGHKSNRVFFTQLYGLGTNISYNLAKAGYNVLKIIPLGFAKDALPFIIRKVQLNPSVREQTFIEKEYIEAELLRRSKSKATTNLSSL